MRGSLGIVIGLTVGAGGMYLALRPPWGGGAIAVAPVDAGVVAAAPTDAGPADKRKKKRRRRGTVAAGNGTGDPGVEEYYEETEPLVALTSADRQLEWRGQDVTLPPTKLDMAGGGEARSLDDGEIGRTISSQAGGVRSCVIQGATNTDLRATITVKLVVDGGGRVIRSKVQAPRYLLDKGLFDCVKRAAGRFKFPATGAATLVTLPVTLG